MLPDLQKIVQFFTLIQQILTSPNTLFGSQILGPLEPLLLQFLRGTAEDMTTGNPVIIGAWVTMLAVANALFLLLVVVGIIQIMVSSNTGSLSLPLSEFVPKILTTAIMMNLSFFWGKLLLQVNNALCDAVNGNLDRFFKAINNGSGITVGQSVILSLAFLILLNIGIIRLLLQAFERLVLWNLLFVLSPLAFLCAFLPATAQVFSFWGRLFVVVTFTQFLQFLAFALAVALLTSAGISGNPLVQMLMALSMLFMVAKIPDMVGRFPGMAVSGSRGIGGVIRTTVIALKFLA